MKNKTITRKYTFWEKKIFNYHNLHMMAYPGSIRKPGENLLKVVREINKLSRWKKDAKYSQFFCYSGISIEGKKSIHNS